MYQGSGNLHTSTQCFNTSPDAKESLNQKVLGRVSGEVGSCRQMWEGRSSLSESPLAGPIPFRNLD